ncbi:hypothetical protein LG290_08155 [Halomonas sediminis]
MALDHFWQCMSESAKYSPLKRMPIDVLMGNWGLENNPLYHAMDVPSHMASPYQLNPMNINPLRDLVEESIDFDMVRKCTAFKLFISATNVETGKVKIFPRKALTADMVMASACLPDLFQAVEIDGVPYWDGGYMGNPSLFPFHGATDTNDIIPGSTMQVSRESTGRFTLSFTLSFTFGFASFCHHVVAAFRGHIRIDGMDCRAARNQGENGYCIGKPPR